MSEEKVGYIYSQALVDHLDKIPKIAGRTRMVHSLINSYALMPHLRIVTPQACEPRQLQTFHSSAYIDYLKNYCGDMDDDDEIESLDASFYGLVDDCPIVDGLFEMCTHIGGASLTAADLLVSGDCKYVVNWFGGWHHAKRERASGYCYVNDCVLAILRLRKRFERVLYIDLDLHHGDGVQEAFEYTNKVLTMSFHKHAPGFYPGTGDLDEIGKGPSGLYHTVNVPLLSGLDDQTLSNLFVPILAKTMSAYQPEAIVVQCGADGLYGDPIDTSSPFNLTLDSYMACVNAIVGTHLPTLFLGGGGYNFANTARLWTSIVGQLSKINDAENVPPSCLLDNDIPDCDPYFLDYAPSYEMRIQPGCYRNKNTLDYVKHVLDTVLTNLNNIKV